jgi:ABC-type Fe3+ transport system substrate-binding protein
VKPGIARGYVRIHEGGRGLFLRQRQHRLSQQGAPHSNAARVFINWFLSREGQLTVQREYAKAGAGVMNSLRMDIPKDMIPQDQQLNEGIQYIDLETPERISMEAIIKLLNDAAGAKN